MTMTSALLQLLCVGLACLLPAAALFIGGAVIPHGDFAYDPSLVNNQNGSVEVHNASVAAGQWLCEQAPDFILLSTPHGMAADVPFAIFGNTNASGFALLGGDLHNASFPEYRVYRNASMEPDLAAAVVAAIRAFDPNVTLLSGWADSEAFPLRWGEVIPLTFLPCTHPSNPKPTRVIVFSQPTRRYTDSVSMIPELLKVGAHLRGLFDALPSRVAMVISSDLAHTHLASGPYGYSAAAEPFDIACGQWGSSLAPTPLLVTAAGLVDKALSCGFTGLVMMHGALQEPPLVPKRPGSAGAWNSTLLANAHPTYYGMMVTTVAAPTP